MNKQITHRHVSASPADQATNRRKLAGGVFLGLVALALGYFLVFGRGQKTGVNHLVSLGDYAGAEIGKLLGGSGTIVVVYDIYDPRSGGTQAGKPFESHLVGVEPIKAKLSKSGAYRFGPDWKLSRPNLSFHSAWPVGEFQKFLAAVPAEATIVMFSDPPAFTAEDKRLLKARTGKLVVVGGTLPEVRGLAREGLAQLVIAARFPVPPAKKDPETAWEQTLRIYGRVTPETSDLP